MKLPVINSRLTCILLLALLSVAVSANTLLNGFVFDDAVQVLRNRWITDASYIPEIFRSGVWGFYGQPSNYYRPVMHLVYMFDYRLFGLAPWGFHLVNVLSHAAVCVLVFLVTEKLVKDIPISFLTAAIFAVHPVHAETVAWVAGAPDTSFALFYLLSLYLYILARGGTGLRERWAFALSVAFYFVSMLCKEPAVTLPALLLAYDYLAANRKDTATGYLKRYIPYRLAFCAYLALRLYALGGFAPNKLQSGIGVYETFLNAVALFAGYIARLAFPFNLSAYHMFHPVHSALDPAFLVPAAITACYLLALYISFRRRSTAALGLVLIAVPLLPSLYISAFGISVFAERYLYLPVAGFGLIVSLLAAKAAEWRPGSRRAVLACLVAALTLYAAGSMARNAIWKSDFTLWSDTVRKAPDAPLPHDSLGVALFSMGRLDEAIAEHNEALRLGGKGTRAHTNLGNAYLVKGMLDRAETEYDAELKEHPADRTAHNGLGVVYGKTGRFDKAVLQFQAAIKADPYYSEARRNLALAYKKMGMTKKISGP